MLSQIKDWLLPHSDHQSIIGGDFNAIRHLGEKQGGRRNLEQRDEDLNFIKELQLLEPLCVKGNFTWSNLRSKEHLILEKLDRFLVSPNWLTQEVGMQTEILSTAGSDHKPVILNWISPSKIRATPFKFQQMWLNHPSFDDLIETWWNEERHIYGTGCTNSLLNSKN